MFPRGFLLARVNLAMSVRDSEAALAAGFSAEGFFSKFSDELGPYLEEVGISRSVLTDPDEEVTLENHCRLMEHAAQQLNEPLLGLKIGARYDPEDMGALGYTIINSPTVLDILQNFARYLRVYSRGCEMRLLVEGSTASFIYRYSIVYPGVIGRRQEAECTLAMIKHAVESATGERWPLIEVHFEHPEPIHRDRHSAAFGAPVYFGEAQNCLKFEKSYLKHKVKGAEPRLYRLLEKHLEQISSTRADKNDIVTAIGGMIANSLSNGVPRMDEIAERLNLTKRTLQRRLADKGVLYNEYVDEIRKNLALQYFESANLPVSEVAFLLGYAQVSAFSRAFRRWTGQTPIEYRACRPTAPAGNSKE